MMTATKREVESLRRLLGHRRADFRERAVQALGGLHTGEALRLLLAQASDRHFMVRARVAEMLGSFRSSPSVRMLRHLLSDADDLVRLNAAEALGQVGNSNSIDALLHAIRVDRDELVRAYAAESLGQLRATGVRVALRDCLASESSAAVRLRLVGALYILGERRRWRELIDFLDDPNYQVRCAAAAMLEERMTPGRRHIIGDALKKRLAKERTEAVRSRLLDILQHLEPRGRRGPGQSRAS
jgi:HEAT repeat protein